MTIKEMEERSGMTRANVRFYEAEGLLSPKRSPNGYRDYSKEDLELLKRIQLLRGLKFSLEEIRAFIRGEQQLQEAMEAHLAQLEEEGACLSRVGQVCREMRERQVGFSTLDAAFYLQRLSEDTVVPGTAGATPPPSRAITEDVAKEPFIPWRRFFARMLDLLLYRTLWDLFLTAVLRKNLQRMDTPFWGLLSWGMPLLLALLGEPTLLHLTGTTAGKWIFGISVTGHDETHLSRAQASTRTALVLWYGLALQFPFFSLWRYWCGYRDYRDNLTLPWEDGSELRVKDTRGLRFPAAALACVFCVLLLYFGVQLSAMPYHRGALSVREYVANVNHYCDYYGMDALGTLREDGTWEKAANPGEVIFSVGSAPTPPLQITTENGIVSEVGFSLEIQDTDEWIISYENMILPVFLALAKAQPSCGILGREAERFLEEISSSSSPFSSHEAQLYGLTVSLKLEKTGFDETPLLLIPRQGKNHLAVQFEVWKAED